MGKKGKWFSNVKKAFSPESKKLKLKVAQYETGVISNPVLVETFRSSSSPLEVKVSEVFVEQNENENECSPSTDVAATTEADVPMVTSLPVCEAVCAPVPRFAGKSKEEAAAILIQTAFRGYLARRAMRAMRGLVRLKLLMGGAGVKRQAANTLKCMQSLSRIQSQIQRRRIMMSQENQARHKQQLLQKRANDLSNSRNGDDDWDETLQSKEQVEANMVSKYEAAMRRERALAYAHTHQQSWKNNARYSNPTLFMDPSNPTWGWSWLERWMAACPCEPSVKDTNYTKINNPRGASRKNNSLSPSTPSRPIPSSRKSNKTTTPSGPDDDTGSTVSGQCGRNRRHSIGGSYVGDRSYMVATESARAKLKGHSPNDPATDENGVAAKKRHSYSGSPAAGPPRPRRVSAPPKVEKGGGAVSMVTTNA